MTGSSSSSSSSNDDIDNSLASRSKRAQEPPSGADTAPSFWSLQIRTVNNKESDDFYVQVHPEDPIDKLYDKIESHTGLSQQQQRLIYRGRLLMSRHNNNNHSANEDKVEEKSKESRKIRDITGLCDGHCIHLVTRKVETPEGETDVTSEATRAESSNSSTGGGSSLLSAILGLGGNGASPTDNNDSNYNNNNPNNEEGMENPADNNTTNGGSTRRWRRFGRRGRAHYRLTSDDLEVPDPGSMESVRQGLLTLHTLLPSTDHSNPLETNRTWYRGQWLDVRDTVNQWLEATVVEIVKPEDVLPPRPDAAPGATARSALHSNTTPVTDPAVHADDLNGRYRLLLEPCPEGCPDEDEGGAWHGFRRRSSNANAVLLLIHYNGWPHRWDEWIRSDSERLRPFRVRTRHPNSSVRASPTVQAPFADQPSTFIRGATEAEDRQYVLPEILRVMQQVQLLMEQAAGGPVGATEATASASTPQMLPWRRRTEDPPGDVVDDNDTVESSVALESYAEQSAADAEEAAPTSTSRSTPPSRREQQRALQAMAPLLDRLGRILVDVAPHVATLARQEPPSTEGLDTINEHPSSLGGLLSMLSRDRRRNSIASSQAVASTNTAGDGQATVTSNTVNSEVSIDPDYTDFAAGLVNTTRGEVRTGPRSRGTSGSDDLSGLLGAYLAAATLASGDGNGDDSNLQLLGRILRDRDGNGSGGGGAGIDIHIHAVVSAPGMMAEGEAGGGGGGIGALLAGLGGGGTPVVGITGNPRTDTPTLADDLEAFLPTARRVPPTVQEDDDLGIFSELYSENPEPTDPPASSRSSDHVITAVASPASSPSRSTRTSSTSHRRSPRHSPTTTTSTTHHSGGGHSANSQSNGNGNNTTSNTIQRRQGFLGRFLRRNQSTE